jgi:polyisoprenoid-binding protein YceI
MRVVALLRTSENFGGAAMKTTGLLLTLILSLVPAMGCASDWQLDLVHSEIAVSISHFGNTVHGKFVNFAGTLEANEATPALSKVEAQIDVASIDTGMPARDRFLQSADFFDAAKFPRITFSSTGIEAQRERNHFVVTGNLTMHGVTKSVSLTVEYRGRGTDQWGNMKAGMKATAKLNRKDFGITLDNDSRFMGDEVDVTLTLEFKAKAMSTSPPATGVQK